MPTTRRNFLTTSAAALAGWRLAAAFAADQKNEFLLSTVGCGRATGYEETNKIISRDGKVHVCWLDSVAEGFRACVRTLDEATNTWSPTVTLGAAHDNHGGPALTIDRRGYLHAVYGPHHHPFRYRRSARPNDASEWEAEIEFGEKLTYPTLVCGPDDTLYFTCRSRSEPTWEMVLWTKRPDGGWTFERALAKSRHRGYAHFQESLAWGPDRRTLHLFFRFHELTDKQGYGRVQTVAYMRSGDFGKTWQRADGSPIALPATAETADVLARGGVDFGRELRAGGLGVDANGRPVVAYSVIEKGKGDLFLARPGGDGAWQSVNLRPWVPQEFAEWSLISPAGLTFTPSGALFIAAQIFQPAPPDVPAWGHPSTEVCLLRSTDAGRSFEFRLISRPDPATPHWLPSIERPTGANAVPEHPGLLYTRGHKGEKNTDLLANEVWWQRL